MLISESVAISLPKLEGGAFYVGRDVNSPWLTYSILHRRRLRSIARCSGGFDGRSGQCLERASIRAGAAGAGSPNPVYARRRTAKHLNATL